MTKKKFSQESPYKSVRIGNNSTRNTPQQILAIPGLGGAILGRITPETPPKGCPSGFAPLGYGSHGTQRDVCLCYRQPPLGVQPPHGPP